MKANPTLSDFSTAMVQACEQYKDIPAYETYCKLVFE